MSMKGITIGINLIVLLVVGVLAIAMIIIFILSTGGPTMGDAQTQRIFATGCAKYCTPDLYQTFKNAYEASQRDPDFIAACVKLGYMPKDSGLVNRCLARCPGCNLDVNQQDANINMDYISTLTDRG